MQLAFWICSTHWWFAFSHMSVCLSMCAFVFSLICGQPIKIAPGNLIGGVKWTTECRLLAPSHPNVIKFPKWKYTPSCNITKFTHDFKTGSGRGLHTGTNATKAKRGISLSIGGFAVPCLPLAFSPLFFLSFTLLLVCHCHLEGALCHLQNKLCLTTSNAVPDISFVCLPPDSNNCEPEKNSFALTCNRRFRSQRENGKLVWRCMRCCGRVRSERETLLAKGAYIYEVRKIFGFFDPILPVT